MNKKKSTTLAFMAAAVSLGVGACAAGDDMAENGGQVAAALTVTGPTSVGDVTILVPPEAAPIAGFAAGWSAIPGLSGAIQTAAGDSITATVTAEMFGTEGAFLRAKVDGIVSTTRPLFVAPNQAHDDVRSFTFVAAGVGAGQHTVEIEWATAQPGHAPHLRDRSMTLHSGGSSTGTSRMAVTQASGGYTVKPGFEAVPGTSATISLAQSGPIAVTFSADTWVLRNRLTLQAVVDGVPVSDVIFYDAETGEPAQRGSRSFTFVVSGISAGAHNVEIRAAANETGVAVLSDRTLVVTAGPEATTDGGMLAGGTQSAAMTVASTSWVDVPGLGSTFNTAAAASTVIIDASAEAAIDDHNSGSASGRLFLRALIDGVPTRPGNVTFVQGEPKLAAQSFSFGVDNLGPGLHTVQVQASVDSGSTGALGDRFLRVLHARRSGAAFVQPYAAMRPKQGSFQTLVVCFDPLRPGQLRPSKAQLRNLFEGIDGGKSARGWWDENSAQRLRLANVTYLGCEDGAWFVPPPEKQGNWYWDNGAFEQMWQDALRAADASFDFHGYDQNQNGNVDPNELLVAIVRPQNDPYGTTRSTSLSLDGQGTLGVHISDLYLSALDQNRTWSVGTIGHEFSHSLNAAQDIYSPCPAETNAGSFSIMSWHGNATHLDPWHKLKSGFVTPDAVALPSLSTQALSLSAVERGGHEVTVLYDPARQDREYFVIENRLGQDASATYDQPLGNSVVLWHVIEDLATRQAFPFPSTEGCRIPVRFLRSLTGNGSSFDFTWADGTSARARITLKSAPGTTTNVELTKTACPPGTDPNTCACISHGDPCGVFQCSGTAVDNCGNVFTCHADCGLNGACPGSGGVCRFGSCQCRTGPPL